MTRVLAIIPARGGSKGLHRKNVVNFCGKPLMAWTILASLASKSVSRTIVSSDDQEILSIAKGLGAEGLERPDCLSDDLASSESAVLHALECEEEHGHIYDVVALLQPTSPLRTAADIDNAMDVFFLSKASSLVSICEIDNKFLKSFFRGEHGRLTPAVDRKFVTRPRQLLPETFSANGAIYIIDVGVFRQTLSFFSDDCVGFEMAQDKSIDIDTLDDLVLAAQGFTDP